MTARRERAEPLRLLVATTKGERRIATVRGGRLCGFLILRGSEAALFGQIYLGQVTKIDRGLDAAFVDCGGPMGFLPLRDAPSNITEGQKLIVQVNREPVDGKAMRLTARPVIAGYRLSLSPFAKSTAFPDGLTQPEKQRLQRVMDSLGEIRRGLNPRRRAVDADAETLRTEAEALRVQWAEIERKGVAREQQLLLPPPEPLFELLREHGTSIEEIICDTRAAAAQIADLCRSLDGALAGKVTFQPRRNWVPSVEELEEQIDEALADQVSLSSGAVLHFGETRAMTAIDVDSGKAPLEGVGAKAERSFLKINLEAAREIGRQLCLRNLGGIIVVDFIDLRGRDLRQQIIDALRDATAGDPQPVWVGAMSRLGLLELTRHRRGPTLAARLLRDCQTCGSRHRVPRDDMRPWISGGI